MKYKKIKRISDMKIGDIVESPSRNDLPGWGHIIHDICDDEILVIRFERIDFNDFIKNGWKVRIYN